MEAPEFSFDLDLDAKFPAPSASNATLKDHIGQDSFKAVAKMHLDAIAKRGGAFPHMLLYGGPGLGKTTLARKLASCLGSELKIYIGEDLNPSRVYELIEELHEGDTIFIDEIHAINRGGAEILYDVMQDFTSMGKPVGKFTLIGATTDAGKVPKPLFDRFKITYCMQPYTAMELSQIVLHHYPSLDHYEAGMCARRCLGVPRRAVALATHIDAAKVSGVEPHKVFQMLSVDSIGLIGEHRKILDVLHKCDKPVSLNELELRVDLPEADIINFEKHLLKLGFISRTPRGRVITDEGREYFTTWKGI